MTRDRAIAELAAHQHGVVTREQLVHRGVGPGAIAHRLANARLHRLHAGVYLVGHPVAAAHAREMAAVLAGGRGAFLSHHPAGALWGMLPPHDGPMDVTVTGASRGSRPGVRFHRTRALDRRDVRSLARVPVTAPARTLLDLAEVAPPRVLERAFDETCVKRLATRAQLAAVFRRCPGRRGLAPLGALLQREAEPAITRSEAEERLLALVRAAGLPEPEVNARVGRHEVDFLWRDASLVVEVDGYAFHSSPAAFERDRLRDAELQAAGFRVMRVTWRQLTREPEALLVRLARALPSIADAA